MEKNSILLSRIKYLNDTIDAQNEYINSLEELIKEQTRDHDRLIDAYDKLIEIYRKKVGE